MKKGSHLRLILLIGGAVVLIVVGLVWRLRSPVALHFLTQPVVRQSLIQSASATGTVNPQNTILVGSQVSGIVSQLFVDYNSPVREGEILARIDPSTFQAAVEQAQANLAQAQAVTTAANEAMIAAQGTVSVAQANADSALAQSAAALQAARVVDVAVVTAEASLRSATSAAALGRQTLARDRALLSTGYIAQSQYDTDQSALVAQQSAFDAAQTSLRQARIQVLASKSQVASSNALRAAAVRQIAQNKAQVLGAEASTQADANATEAAASLLQEAKLNLAHTVIISPVSGTVIARSVSVGQTIASSFAAPTLFSIAQDLNKMEVDIAVGEPDIGAVVVNAPLEFTVLAYPNTSFQSHVTQVRENPTTIANVVTYDVVTLIDNHDRRLRPGMTATALIRVGAAQNALVVPLAALQWTPQQQDNTSSPTPPPDKATAASPWGETTAGANGAIIAGTSGAIYLNKGGKALRVPVHILLVSGVQAAVSPVQASLSAGDLTIIGTSITKGSRTTAPLPGLGGAGRGGGRGMHL